MNIIPTSEFLLDNILWLMSIHVHEGGGGGYYKILINPPGNGQRYFLIYGITLLQKRIDHARL